MGKYLKKFSTHNDYQIYIDSSIKKLPNISYCKNNNEIHFNPGVNNNKHDYVDLKLPSGTLWAAKNVGATSITDGGLYFAWGETIGYTSEQLGVDKNFSDADYELGDGDMYAAAMTKYNSSDGKTILESIDDAATVNMGGAWHMPSIEQIQELLNTTYVTNEWVTDYQGSGVNGRLFTSVADNSVVLFFPGIGICQDGSITAAGSGGSIWSKNIDTSTLTFAKDMSFLVNGANVYSYARYCGFSIRGVIG